MMQALQLLGLVKRHVLGEEIKFEALPILELCLSERISK